MFVGYAEQAEGYRVLIQAEEIMKICRDVKFIENCDHKSNADILDYRFFDTENSN